MIFFSEKLVSKLIVEGNVMKEKIDVVIFYLKNEIVHDQTWATIYRNNIYIKIETIQHVVIVW